MSKYNYLVSDSRGVKIYRNRDCPKSARAIVACQECGNPLIVTLYDLKHGHGQYCGRKCMGLAQRGPASPNWLGGDPNAMCWVRSRKRLRACGSTVKIDYARLWQKVHPERPRSHHAVRRAVKTGRLTRPERCERCGKTGKLHAHHEDYTKPLDVIWVCPTCHKAIHRAA